MSLYRSLHIKDINLLCAVLAARVSSFLLLI